MPEHTTFISFGYRCSSAGILKRLGLKHESYPFDWIVSRIPVIRDCIETDFVHYLNSDNYIETKTCVASYDYDPMIVCVEPVLYNTHYLDISMASYHTSLPLTKHRDTYAYPFAMNHHNIRLGGHYDYFVRCVGRWREFMGNHTARKMFLYIHPALHADEYSDRILDEIAEFQTWLCDRIGWRLEGLVFFPIKTEHPYPITEHMPQSQFIYRIQHPQLHHAYKVYMNRDFVDAGEIFYRNAFIEGDAMVDLVKAYAHGTETPDVFPLDGTHSHASSSNPDTTNS